MIASLPIKSIYIQMKTSILFLAAIAGCITACNSKSGAQKTESTSTATTKESYEYINNKDTITLNYTANGNIIIGTLKSILAGSTRSVGTLEGTIKGDTIIADYTMDAAHQEKTAVRQVAFLKKNGKLLEGYGETGDKDGKIVFTNISHLKFVDAVTLSSKTK